MTIEQKRKLDVDSMSRRNVIVKWKDQEFIYIGGALATREQYDNFEPSTAHVMNDGVILQFGVPVGTVEEVTEI